MIMTDDQKKQVMGVFDQWRMHKDTIRALNNQNTELLKALADAMGVKKKALTQVFRDLRTYWESGEDPQEGVVEIFESLKDSTS